MQVPIKDIINVILSVSLLIVFLAGFIVLLTSVFHKARRNFELEKENLNKEIEAQILKTQLEIQEQTLENISQEIHDNIGQALTFVKLTINTIDLTDTEDTINKMNQSKELISNTIKDLRNLSKTLNPDFVSEVGLVPSIEYQLSYLRRSGSYTIDFTCSEKTTAYPPKTEIIVYRIVQELLNNIVKHAEASAISLSLQYDDDSLLVAVKDNGKGFVMTDKEGLVGIGLKNMKKRLSMVKGTLAIESEVGKGTTIQLSVPNE